MADHAVVHFEIGGPDGEALQDFYGKLFDWTINADNPILYGETHAIGNGIGGGIFGGMGEPGVTIYVEVGSLEETLAKVNELGGKTLMEPGRRAPGGRRSPSSRMSEATGWG